jgi:hypothetical protein
MTARAAIVLTAIWLASLAATATITVAQVQLRAPSPAPTILSSSDIGFRIDSQAGGVPTGTLVIRIDGQWVEPRISGSLRMIPVR